MNPQELYTRFDAVFFEKTRLSMLTLLNQEGSVSFNRFKQILAGSDGSVYSHLKKLVDAGYVKQRKQIATGRVETVYSLTAGGRRLFRKYLQFMEEILKSNTRSD
jgi:DNA-binding PadR family transcriptional regulator